MRLYAASRRSGPIRRLGGGRNVQGRTCTLLSTLHDTFSVRFWDQPSRPLLLLTNKTADTYARVLQQLRNLVPLADPKTVLVDFERGR